MVTKIKKSPEELQRMLHFRAWEILWRYMDRLGDPEVIEATDARASAGVVKTLLEGINRAQENLPEEEAKIELPEIPEKALEEALHICYPELLPGTPVKKTRSTRTRVSDRPGAQAPA